MNDGNYTCRHCCAKLLLKRIEVEPNSRDRATCPNCGEPLQPRDGKYLLQYTLVQRPQSHR